MLGPKKADSGVTTVGQEIEWFHNGSGATISAKDWVETDTSVSTYGLGSAIKQYAGTANAGIRGVALHDIPDGEVGEVVVYGPVENASVLTGVAAGAPLHGHNVAGQATTGTIGTNQIIGQCMELAAASVADVFVTCK